MDLKVIDTIHYKLGLFKSKTQSTKFLEATSPDVENLPKYRLTALSLHNNIIWAGSFENGYYAFELDTKTFKTDSQADSKSLI